MIQCRNGQSQSEREQSKPKGRFTGQHLKTLRPDIYRRAVELSAEPREQVPYDHICRLLRVSEHTLKAIEKTESLSIAERKERLLAKAWRLANKAIDRVEDQIDDANITQATIAFGVSTEKILLLLGESGGIPLQVNLQITGELLHARYNELMRQITEGAGAESEKALPNGETFSVAGAMGLQRGKNCQKASESFPGISLSLVR